MFLFSKEARQEEALPVSLNYPTIFHPSHARTHTHTLSHCHFPSIPLTASTEKENTAEHSGDNPPSHRFKLSLGTP